MPEGLEAEMYRRAAESVVGRVVERVEVDERQADAPQIRSWLPGATVVGVGRRGKQVWLDFSGGQLGAAERTGQLVRLGIHFGMAGRLVVDQHPTIDALAYSSSRWEPSWNRLTIQFRPDLCRPDHALSGVVDTDGTPEAGQLIVNDPRRWARFVLEPDLSHLGPDLFDLDASVLAARFRGRTSTIKAALLDQAVVSGLGNMLIDEILFHAGVAPTRTVDDIDQAQVAVLAAVLDKRLPEMLAAGGSHSGVLDPETRSALGHCPRCGGGDLKRSKVAGRTTIWCSRHQT